MRKGEVEVAMSVGGDFRVQWKGRIKNEKT